MNIFHLDFNHVSMRNEVIKDMLPKIAAMGYTAILWELEAQVAWETCPECATSETWTKDQFRELLVLSREYNLEPIPLLQTIGHGEYVMAHANYHKFRENPEYADCYCVSNPEVRAFLIRWIAEYCELFGELRYFHLGGDEAYRFGSCPVCAARSRLELYGEHIDALSEGLLANGIRPGIWSDMILAEPDELKSISHDFMIWDWNYQDGMETPESVSVRGHGRISRDQITPELSRKIPELLDSTGMLNTFHSAHFLKRRGYNIILCSAARSAADGPFCPNTLTHASNIAAAEQTSQCEKLMGHCVTSWSIRLNPIRAGFPLMAIPKIVSASPALNFDAWRKEVSQKYFGFENGMDAADLISRSALNLRPYTAIQWTGMKDGRPPEKNYLDQRIKQMTTDKDPRWLNIKTILADIKQSTLKGLSLMEPHAPAWPITALWVRAARLQLEYLNLLQTILFEDADLKSMNQPLQRFQCKMEAFFAREQTRISARNNAALIVTPLRDYLT